MLRLKSEILIPIILFIPFFSFYLTLGPVTIRTETVAFLIFAAIISKNILATHTLSRFNISYFLLIGLIVLSLPRAYLFSDIVVGIRMLFSITLVYLAYHFFYTQNIPDKSVLNWLLKYGSAISIVIVAIGLILFYDYNVLKGNNGYGIDTNNPVLVWLFNLFLDETKARHAFIDSLNFLIILNLLLALIFHRKTNFVLMIGLLIVSFWSTARAGFLSGVLGVLIVLSIYYSKGLKVKNIIWLGIFLAISIMTIQYLPSTNYHVKRVQKAIPTIDVFKVSKIEEVRFSTIGRRIDGIVTTIDKWPKLSNFNKLFGAGYGSFKKYSNWKIHSHNSYIEILFNFGLVGLFLFLFFLFSNIIEPLRRYSFIRNPFYKLVLLLVFGNIVSTAISSFLAPTFLHGTIKFPLWFFLGYLCYLLNSKKIKIYE